MWWTEDKIDWLRQNVPGVPYSQVTARFNEHFGECISKDALRSMCKKARILNGFTGRYEKGSIPFYKGKKMPPEKAWKNEGTRFHKGDRPMNWRPTGSERLNVEGYIEIKTDEHKRWRYKHRVVWEAVNGPIPPGHVLIFKDGNKLNTDIDNLKLITKAENIRINQMQIKRDSAEMTEVAVSLARLKTELYRRKKGKE